MKEKPTWKDIDAILQTHEAQCKEIFERYYQEHINTDGDKQNTRNAR